jgi:glutathione peroxidase
MSALYDIPVKHIDGTDATLAEHKGEVLLIVNVASKCGLTPQYDALEKVYETYHDKRFAVLGFPANDFAGQEPGTNEEIQTFCSTKFNVTFPLYEKIAVTGDAQHPLYAHLTNAVPAAEGTADFRKKLTGYGMTPAPEPAVLWNFEKFLVNRSGDVVRRFSPDTPPDDPKVTAAIEAELAKG